MRRIFSVILVVICMVVMPAFVSRQAPQKEIALTFDDEIRPKVFFGDHGLHETLLANHAPATFFALGYQAKEHPELFQMLVNHSYEVENHTWGHENLLKLERKVGIDPVLQNIEKASHAIEAACGRRPIFFRPPYWAINSSIKDAIASQGYRVMTIDNPDINSLDYDDYAHHRPASVLRDRVFADIRTREEHGIYRHVLVFHEVSETPEALAELLPLLAKRGYRFVTLEEFFEETNISKNCGVAYAAEIPGAKSVRAMYLSVDNIYSKKKITALEKIFVSRDANALVIDFKVDRPIPDKDMKKLVARFRGQGIYLIARIVVMQDSYLARNQPKLAVRHGDGSLWLSGAKKWHRYWVDPASPEVLEYNVEITKRAINLGFDEINFDYIQFPTDGNLHDIIFPIFKSPMGKSAVMNEFFRKLTFSLREYNPRVILSVDLFGEVSAYGSEKGIGQELTGAGNYFDVVCPMAYPSHYQCGEFGFHDPTVHPYEVYRKTLDPAVRFFKDHGARVKVRPWIQAFSIRSIYGCGPRVYYGPREVRSEIQAGTDLGVNSFMLWNAGSNYSPEYFDKK